MMTNWSAWELRKIKDKTKGNGDSEEFALSNSGKNTEIMLRVALGKILSLVLVYII